MVQMTYNFKDQFVDNSNNTNIYIACFTTSHVRLMLYDKLDYLNEKVLYFDADSIIYADNNTKNIKLVHQPTVRYEPLKYAFQWFLTK